MPSVVFDSDRCENEPVSAENDTSLVTHFCAQTERNCGGGASQLMAALTLKERGRTSVEGESLAVEESSSLNCWGVFDTA